MIKNIVFDIGNVILNFNYQRVLNEYTKNKEDQEFINNYIFNSKEWLKEALLDIGYLTREEAIKLVQDRTNHTKDFLIADFWNKYTDYAYINDNVLELIEKLKQKNYKIYLLSNMNIYTYESIKNSKLFKIVDGYVLSYLEHQIKPNKDIYNTLINKYSLIPNESIFIDDNINNIKTAKKIGFISKKVEPDDYDSIVVAIKEEITY